MKGKRTAAKRPTGGRRVLRGGSAGRARRALRVWWTERSVRSLACLLALPLLALLLVPRQEQAPDAVQTGAAAAGQGAEKYIALTFDDGPWPVTTERLLDGLAERGAKATFFLIGEQIGTMEDTVRRMQAEGHQIGNHTYTHMDLSRGDSAERVREIEKTDETLRALLGDGSYWLRPPVTDCNHDMRYVSPQGSRYRAGGPRADGLLVAGYGGLAQAGRRCGGAGHH